MGMSEFYGAADETEAIATIHRALELGVTMLDTADAYGYGDNEVLVGHAVADRREEVLSRPSSGSCATGWTRPCAGSTGARSTCSRPVMHRCAASDSSTSTCTTSTGSIVTCRSRKPLVPWPSSSMPARCATSGFPRPRRRRFAAPTPCIRSRRCRASTRCGAGTSRMRCCRRSASSASAWSPTARSGAAF